MQDNIFRNLMRLPKNARTSILLQPLYAIPFHLYTAYASLYMMELGITSQQVGWVSSASYGAKILVALFGGYIVNRMGRRRSGVLFDIISWLIPLYLWMTATSAWHFMAAGIINSVMMINGMVSSFYMTEDVDMHQRVHAFTANEVINVSAGFVAPLAGLFIARFGLVDAMRGMYAFAFVCMCLLVLGKWFLLTETTVGERMRRHTAGWPHPLRSLRGYGAQLRQNRRLLSLIAINILCSFAGVFFSLFYFPLLKNGLGYSDSIIALFPLFSSIITLLVQMFLMPRIVNKRKALAAVLCLQIAGFALLALAYGARGSTLVGALVAGSILLRGIAQAGQNPIMMSEIANQIPDEKRAETTSFTNILSTLFLIPAGAVGGFLYSSNPVFPFLLAIVAFGLALVVCGTRLSRDGAQ